ncbi:hypothetical protein OE88DRAFT_1405730 [Heliocybe sulcata]|uniref:Uncharacterized protein n=1 Tax=Heliocybe sulcata TaxID=5364 RepID=A0A5C3N3X7_9AGAM|nr:hypothetical protein OE88DRAFT_1405730 [Heliocybe sulcata]
MFDASMSDRSSSTSAGEPTAAQASRAESEDPALIRSYLEAQLDSLRQLLQTSKEACEKNKRVAEEREQEKAIRREQKDRSFEDMQAKIAQIAGEQERHRGDAREEGSHKQWDSLKQELDASHEERINMLMTFLEDSREVNRRQHESIRAAIEESRRIS